MGLFEKLFGKVRKDKSVYESKKHYLGRKTKEAFHRRSSWEQEVFKEKLKKAEQKGYEKEKLRRAKAKGTQKAKTGMFGGITNKFVLMPSQNKEYPKIKRRKRSRKKSKRKKYKGEGELPYLGLKTQYGTV